MPNPNQAADFEISFLETGWTNLSDPIPESIRRAQFLPSRDELTLEDGLYFFPSIFDDVEFFS